MPRTVTLARIIVAALATFAAASSSAVEWSIKVDEALLLREMVRYDHKDRGLLVRDRLDDGSLFLTVRGQVTVRAWGDNESSLKVTSGDVAVAAGDRSFPIAANKWSPLHFSSSLRYFSVSKPRGSGTEVASQAFLFVFIVPADAKPTQLKVLDQTAAITPQTDKKLPTPAETAHFRVSASRFVEQLTASETYRVSASNQRVTATRAIVAPQGKLLGVTIQVKPKTGGYKNPDQWHYTFRDFGIVVDGGGWSAAVTQSAPSGKGFTSSGGGILVTRGKEGWPVDEGTFFFVVPAAAKSFQITLAGEVVASGNIAAIAAATKASP